MKLSKIQFGRPVRKKQITYPEQLKIEGLSHEGRGIARIEGKTIFVSGALPGEEVTFKIDKQHRRYDEAHAVDLITESPERVKPLCEHYGECGGCDLQHLSHPEQIKQKQQLVLDQLSRLGKFSPEKVEAPICSESWEYRRSCRIGINQLQRDGSALVGFRRRNSDKLTPIKNCPVLQTGLNQLLQQLPQRLEQFEQFKEITHAEISQGEEGGALTLRIKKKLPDPLAHSLAEMAEEAGFKLYFDNGKQTTPYRNEANLFYPLKEQQLKVYFAPGDFLQINAGVNLAMINRALNWLAPESGDRVLDLFSGVGNFTLPLAKYCEHVVGVEGVDEMVQRATDNAARNKLQNCQFYRADLSKDLRALPWFKQGFNKIVLDPPRSGALEVIKQLPHYNAEAILYVSCNPAALARDGAELIKQGYRATRFCVMDMFPHTSHVESLVLFETTESK